MTVTSSQPALQWRLSDIMANLVELEEQVHPDLRVYRWRPRAPDLPCMWNWMTTAPQEQRDLGRFRDNIQINVHIAIRHTDLDEETSALETYVDAFREIIDPALNTMHPLGAQRAIRVGMQTLQVEFGGDVPALAVQFPIMLQVDRMIQRS